MTVLCYALMGCTMSRSADPLRLDEGSNAREVVVRPHQQVELALGENPTTGFRWELIETGGPACVLRESIFDAPTGGLGKGGTHRWLFDAVQSGVCRIALVYRRSWEDKPPAREFRVTVRVEG